MGAPDHLVFTTQPSFAGGTVDNQFGVQPVVKVVDAAGNVCTGNTSTVTLTPVLSADDATPGAGTLTGIASMAAVAGVAAFTNVGYNKTDSIHLHAADGALTVANSTTAIALTAGAVTHFVVSGITDPVVAGTASDITITAKDQYNNTNTGYTGTVNFTSSDSQAELPEPYTFLGGDNGTHTINNGVTMKTVGERTVTATDSITGSINGTQTAITVTHAAASKWAIIDPTDGTVDAAITVTVQLQDQYGNIVTTGADKDKDVTLNANGGAAASGGVVNISNGVGTIAITDHTAQTVDLTLSDSGEYGFNTASTQNVVFAPGAAAKILVETAANGTGSVVALQNIAAGSTVTGYSITRDQYNNFIANAAATWSLINKTGGVVNGDLVPAGGNLSAIFTGHIMGTVEIHAASGILTSTDSGTITVLHGTANKFVIINPTDGTVDAAITVTVQLQDQYGNLVTSGADKDKDVTLNADGGAAASGGVVDIANGTGTIAISDQIAQTVNLTLTDSATTGFTCTSSQDVIFAHGAASKFVIINPADGTVDAAITVTVQLQDQYGNIVTTGADKDKDVTLGTDGAATGAGLVNISNGVGTIAITDHTAQTVNLTLTDSEVTGFTCTSTQNVVYAPGAAVTFVVTGPAAMTAGADNQFVTITAKDSFGNTAISYTGDKDITFSGATTAITWPGVGVPPAASNKLNQHHYWTDGSITVAFTNGVAVGGHDIGAQIWLCKVETAHLRVTDLVAEPDITTPTALDITVSTGAPYRVIWDTNNQLPSPVVAGATWASANAMIADEYGNPIDTSDNITVALNTGTGELSGTLTRAASHGIAAFNDLSMTTTGTKTLTATSGEVATDHNVSRVVTVNPAAIDHFTVTGIADPVIAGASSTITVTALDVYDNVQTGYTGTVHFTSTDAGGSTSLPADHAFVGGDNGVHTFTVVLTTAGSRSVTATGSTKTGQQTVTVNPAAAAYLTVTGTASINSGATDELTVGAYDTYGNLCNTGANNYNGAHNLTFSGPAVIGENNPSVEGTNIGAAMIGVIFTNGVTSGSNLTLTAYKAETVTVGVSDGSINSTGHGLAITVNPAAAHHLALVKPAGNVTAGTQFTFTSITALDQYGNTATSYSGDHTIWWSISAFLDGPDSGVDTRTNPVHFTNGVSDTALNTTCYRAQSNIFINATELGLPGFASSIACANFNILHAAANHLKLVAPAGPQIAGTQFAFTSLTAVDQYGNVANNTDGATPYSGDHTITWSMITGTANGPTSGTDSFTTTVTFGNNGIASTALSTTLNRAQSGVIIRAAGDGLAGTNVACSAFNVIHATSGSIGVTLSPTTPLIGQPVDLTITAIDTYGNALNNTNGAAAFSGNVYLSTDAVSYTLSIPQYTFTSVNTTGTKTLIGAITFSATESNQRIYASNYDSSLFGQSASFDIQSTTPTVTTASNTPEAGAINVLVSVTPTIYFSEAMNPSTINTSTVQLRKRGDDSAVDSIVTYSQSALQNTAIIYPRTNLAYSTQYYLWVTGPKNQIGSTVTAYNGKPDYFTTAVDSAVAPVIPTIAIHTDEAAIVSAYTASDANTRFSGGLRFSVTNSATASVNGGASSDATGGTVTAASNAQAKTLGAHSYNVVVTSSTGNTASMLVTYQVYANDAAPIEPVIPTIAIYTDEASIVSAYTASDANTRFSGGLRFTVTNSATASVNGGAPSNATGGTVTAASNAQAKTLGAHSYNVVVTSSTGNTASMLVTYQVYADGVTPVIPTIALNGAAVLATYTVNDANIRFASGVQFTTTNAATSSINGSAPGEVVGELVTAANNTNAKTVGAHNYTVMVTSTTGHTASINVSYQVINNGPTTGIAVSAQILKSYATADNTYANGWEFKFNITVYDPNETLLKMQFTDWAGTSGTIAANGNMKIAMVDDVSAAVAVGNNYTDQATSLTLTDEDPNAAGIQETIYVFIKVPSSASGGSYSTSYGIHTAGLP